jgi:hypothetical protein
MLSEDLDDFIVDNYNDNLPPLQETMKGDKIGEDLKKPKSGPAPAGNKMDLLMPISKNPDLKIN